ncbi:MAG: sodium/solute symporter [Planctomycetes bacterium]|nr:sodium/solute symporter [Planctomycetota bacterium]
MNEAPPQLRLSWPDGLILLAYLALLVGIGVWHSRRHRTAKDYFLAGKTMRWLPVGLSLMAALNSGLDYIMQPSAMIKFGAVVLVVNLSWLFLVPYVSYITLPMFRRMDCTSAYEYLERRFGAAVRALTAGIFLLWRLGWMATALYVPCLAIAAASGNEEHITTMIVVLGIIVTAYTMMGGIKAVIWTDVAQFCIMFGGLAATILVILAKTPGGLEAFLADFSRVGADLRIETPQAEGTGFLGGTLEYFFIPVPVAGLLVATLVTRVANYTSDQVMVQRFQTSRSIGDARKGFVVTAAGDIVWMLALCFVGVALFTYFRSSGGMPESIRQDPDQIFPYFMAVAFPAGVAGLVIAAILAASLSSIDSAINSMTAVAMVDFYERLWRKRPDGAARAAGGAGAGCGNDREPSPEEGRRQLLASRVFTVLIGAAGFALAANVSRLGTLLEISN